MTPEQRAKLNALAEAARPQPIGDDDDWGSDRQIDAEIAFHNYVSDDLGVNTEDMQCAKASSEDMINEALRRVEMAHLCDELSDYCVLHNLPLMSADELVCELQAVRGGETSAYVSDQVSDMTAHIQWLSAFIQRWEAWEAWREWYPRP